MLLLCVVLMKWCYKEYPGLIEIFHLKQRNFFLVHPVICTYFRNKSLWFPSNLSACSCDAVGTINPAVCNTYGGQCNCKQNIYGRTCSSCLPDHYNFTSGLGCRGKRFIFVVWCCTDKFSLVWYQTVLHSWRFYFLP